MYGRALVRTSLRGISSVRPLRSRPTRLGFTSSRYRSSSSATAFSSTRTDDSTSQEYLPSTQSPKPFAIEHVGGREHHLSWSPKGGISKEWKEEKAIDADVTNGTPQAVSSPMMSGAVGRMKSWFMQMFLPTNYPHSVHRSYAPYHILQFVETTLGTLVSVLCNQALLSSVGVSAEGSIFGAVAVQWIIKDGAGEIAKLFFIRRFSPYFDSHPKTFNLLGEGAVALGSGLQIATLLINPTPVNFLICAAGGNIFKLIGNAIWLTTHIKFVRYFSQQGNTGDVAAKEESQASVAQLLGYSAGIGLLTFSHSPAYLYSIFFLSVPVHLLVTTYMLQLTTFELLTVPRLSWLAGQYAKKQDGKAERGVVDLAEVEKLKTTGLFGEFYKRKRDRYVSLAPKLEDVVVSNPLDRSKWTACAEAFHGEKYLLYPPPAHSRKPISAFYDPSASVDDMLRSILHAAHLHELLSNQPHEANDANLRPMLAESATWTNKSFPDFKSQLEANGWKTEEICSADHGRRVSWQSAPDKAE
ncbi:unnamed protein product [Somion occarium]|uniref:DUF647-domain-containing protein n=1 Tax=Somion occarium TaxID=3059160 RepID=A0ABP1EAA2_9APHY